MKLFPALVLAEDATALPTGVTAALAVAVAVAALLGRRSLPAGIAEATLISAVSGGAILLLAIDPAGSLSHAALGHVLAALAVVWYAASRLEARSAAAGAAGGEITLVWACAALACGLATVANLAATPGGWPAGAADFTVLLVLSGLIWAFRTRGWAPYPAIALLVILLAITVPACASRTSARAWSVGLNAAALLCLAVAIGSILRDWHRQRRRWLDEPQLELADVAAGPGSLLSGAAVGVCVLIGLAGVLMREHWLTPSAVWLAALACLVVGHVRQWVLAGEIGLVLVAEGIVSTSMAWVSPGWPGALFGLGLAGGYLLWLARFWDQQLLDGSAWTTAGRLIPASRRLAYVASSATFAAAAGGMLAGAFAEQNVWLAAVTTLLLLGSMSLLVRDGSEHGRPGAVATACLVTLAAVGPASTLFARATGEPLMAGVGAAAAGLLVALRVLFGVAGGRCPRVAGGGSTAGAEPGRHWFAEGPVFAGFVCGVLPVVALLVLSWHGLTPPSVTGLALTLAAVAVGAVVLRRAAPTRRGRAPAGA